MAAGGSPYPRMEVRQIANLLQEWYRMPKPQHNDEKLHEIMRRCWQNDPHARPTFIELKKQLKERETLHKAVHEKTMQNHAEGATGQKTELANILWVSILECIIFKYVMIGVQAPFLDNFFTSIPLLQELSELSISVVGTIRNNRKNYPKALQGKNLLKQMKRGEFHTVASETTVCTVWKDTKHVSFLSNVHSSHGNCTITRKLRRGEQVNLPCPPCAVDYNKNMGAVDRHDQMVRNYAIDRKSRRWWVRMFVNFLDAIMVNAYIVYKENFRIMNMPPPQKPPKPLSHDKFMAGVIHKLIGNFSCRRQPGPAPAMPPPPFHGRDHDSVNLADLGLLKFGRCHHCCIGVKGAKRKETGFGCRSCMKRLCRSGCHEEYHRQNNIF
ncbi:Tyrosine-protein kinase isoform SRK4 [Stylophora pistillata]|uniref:Tyrosine-protein kinase isoform SRK4 n=1 Tax=Stylophora pistillata TaxID=50429 RepID=A0A2B4SRW4_STYPI|nr:Tyrosine-protein kinase isoform SRK4 [Stylophora pistillata]